MQSADKVTAIRVSSRLVSRQLCAIRLAGSSVTTAAPSIRFSTRIGCRISSPGSKMLRYKSGKKRWSGGFVRLLAATEALEYFPVLRAISDAKAGSHKRHRDPLQIGEQAVSCLYPMELILLQLQILRDDSCDYARISPRGSIAVRRRHRPRPPGSKRPPAPRRAAPT